MTDDIRLDQASWRALQRERGREHVGPLRMVAQAAVRAENLTGDPNWDYFLSILQDTIERTSALASGFRAKLEAPGNVSHETLLECKMALRECLARQSTLESVMTIPKELIQNGEVAAATLSRLDAGTAADPQS